MKYLLLLGILIILVFYAKVKANASTDDYEVSLEVHTSTQIHEMFPEVEDRGKEMQYILGWIRVREDAKKDIKYLCCPTVVIWNNFFKVEIKILGASGYKSYFLIPLGGVHIGEEPLKHRIK